MIRRARDENAFTIHGCTNDDPFAIGREGKPEKITWSAKDFREGLGAIFAEKQVICVRSTETNVQTIGVCRVNSGDVWDFFRVLGVEKSSRPCHPAIIGALDPRSVNFANRSADVHATRIGRRDVDSERDHVVHHGIPCLCPRHAVVGSFRENHVKPSAHPRRRDRHGFGRIVSMNRDIDDVFAFERSFGKGPRTAAIVGNAEAFEDAGEHRSIRENSNRGVLSAAITNRGFTDPTPRSTAVGTRQDAVRRPQNQMRWILRIDDELISQRKTTIRPRQTRCKK